jgi:rare lipoprotein A (peptidoglycan hydrolase)
MARRERRRASLASRRAVAFTVVAVAAALVVGAGVVPPRGAWALIIGELDDAVIASTDERGLDPAEDTSKTAEIREPSGIVAIETASATTRTKTVIPAPPKPKTAPASSGASTSGWNSAYVTWYGPGFYGHTMAGGGTLTPDSMVVAHRTLRFGTRIEFSYKGRTCIAVVQDRGPVSTRFTFDLGPGTAKALGFSGVGTVKYRILN